MFLLLCNERGERYCLERDLEVSWLWGDSDRSLDLEGLLLRLEGDELLYDRTFLNSLSWSPWISFVPCKGPCSLDNSWFGMLLGSSLKFRIFRFLLTTDLESLVEGHTILRQPLWLEWALLIELALLLCLFLFLFTPLVCLTLTSIPRLGVGALFENYERVVAARGLDRVGLLFLFLLDETLFLSSR